VEEKIKINTKSVREKRESEKNGINCVENFNEGTQ
jgi:hypothetical protein